MRKLIEYGSQSEKLRMKHFWIGLISIVGTANMVWASDQTPASVNESFWNKYEPNYDGRYVHTVQKTMLLNDRADFAKNKPICQKDLKKDEKRCEKDGWILQKQQCYKFMTKSCGQGCTWQEAISICQQNGGKLTEGPDFLVLRIIAKGLDLANWWVGFSDLKKEGVYVAESDGKQVNLTEYFADGEPSFKKENCLEMRYELDLKLNDGNCKADGGSWESTFQPLCQISGAGKGNKVNMIFISFTVAHIFVLFDNF